MTKNRTYRVVWSDEDECFVGTCAEYPNISHLDGNEASARKGIQVLVEQIAKDISDTQKVCKVLNG